METRWRFSGELLRVVFFNRTNSRWLFDRRSFACSADDVVRALDAGGEEHVARRSHKRVHARLRNPGDPARMLFPLWLVSAPRVTSCRRLSAATDRPGLEGRTGLSQVARSSLAHRRRAPARPSCSKHRRRPRQAAIYTPVAFGRRAPSFDSASISSGRQRGGIEQHVSTCDNIEKVIPLSSIHIIR